MMKQSTSSVLMIRPLHFGFNEQTAVTNSFQNRMTESELLQKVQHEFDAMVDLLRSKGIEVLVFEDRADVVTPDAVFPNNWISISNNTITLFPMLAENRKAEVRKDIVDFFRTANGTQRTIIDLTGFENEGSYLEGTGSMVLDHENRIAYAALSPRTNEEVLYNWCAQLNYKPITFTALDGLNKPIYHTNVMMAIGTGYALLAAGTIVNKVEKAQVELSLTQSAHELVNISSQQMEAFAGNMLELENLQGKKFLVMSDAAYKILSLAQLEIITKYAEPLVCKVPNIETVGGGSVRCMIAEVFN